MSWSSSWYSLAGIGGIDIAVENREVVTASMTKTQLAEAQDLLGTWKSTELKTQ